MRPILTNGLLFSVFTASTFHLKEQKTDLKFLFKNYPMDFENANLFFLRKKGDRQYLFALDFIVISDGMSRAALVSAASPLFLPLSSRGAKGRRNLSYCPRLCRTRRRVAPTGLAMTAIFAVVAAFLAMTLLPA